MVNKIVFFISILYFQQILSGQESYKLAFQTYKDALSEKTNLSFKEAVFHCENAYFDHQIRFEDFNAEIGLLKTYVNVLKSANTLYYDKEDKDRISIYAAIFLLMTDTIIVKFNKDTAVQHLPYTYDFEDIFGSRDWTQTFISKLLTTGTGNCHSLPYLYKMLCDELNVPCYLALAPNHLYIKLNAKKGGWYNTELTSATFPVDAWLMASGYITLEAIQNGIYMDTLSEKESIALCVIDLAQGFNHKYPDNNGDFVIECCDLALKYFPDYINGMLLKAETRLRQLQQMQKRYGYAYLKEVTNWPEGKVKWDEMNTLYGQLIKLGYRQMPEEMYVDWLTSLKKEKEKYLNKQVPGAIKN
jgi:hypothetical protein